MELLKKFLSFLYTFWGFKMDHRCANCGKRGLRNHFTRSGRCPRCHGSVVTDSIPWGGSDNGGRQTDLMNIVGITPIQDPLYTSASFLSIITPDDVGAEKRSISPYMEETNIKVSLMKQTIPANVSTGWADCYRRWVTFYKSSPGILTAGSDYKTSLQFRFELSAWQKNIDKFGGEPLTAIPLPNEAPPGAATTLSGASPSIWDKLKATSNTWSNLAWASLIVGAALAAYLIYWQAKTAQKNVATFGPAVSKMLTLG